MNLGIIGLPQAGKKTVFELLTGVAASNAPARDGIAIAVARVRDPRVDKLVEMYKPKKMRYAEFEVSLPPDIVPNKSRTAEWLEPLRKMDAILVVVRAFESESVFHPSGSVDPARDVALIQTELLIADLDLAEKRLDRMEKDRTKGRPVKEHEIALMQRCKTHLEQEQPLRTLTFSEEEMKIMATFLFLTSEPQVVVFNTGEAIAAETARLQTLADKMRQQHCAVAFLSAAIEDELAGLAAEEQAEFMKDLGVEEPAAHRLSRAALESLGLISFFTVSHDEVRAWPLRRGATALDAAGKIHTDLARGFIRANTIAFDDLMRAGSEKAAHAANLFHLHGKTYEVKDGDVIEIRFNV
jgi:hypothetical protein